METVVSTPKLDVSMECDDLVHFPRCTFPAGYTIRPYQPGDERAWQHLHQIGDALSLVDFNDAFFIDQFGSDLELLRSRMFYVVAADGEIAGSISAWFSNDQPPLGLIHWVIVHPDHRRRGLAKPMMTRTMQRLAQSHERAVLGTSLARPWAIKVYLDFGFLPAAAELNDPIHYQGWATLQKLLHHPRLANWLERR